MNNKNENNELKKELIQLNYNKEYEILEKLKKLNNFLLSKNIKNSELLFFESQYEKIINFIENNKLFQNNLEYFSSKVYFHYKKKKEKRLITLINSNKFLEGNDNVLFLLIKLLLEKNYNSKEILKYQNLIKDKTIKNKISKILEEQIEKYIPKELYRISRISNLESILSNGILSRNLIEKIKIKYENNSYSKIQKRREIVGSYDLHNYVPLFFSLYPAMIYSKQVKENIKDEIIITFEGNLIKKEGTIFSDISLAYGNKTEKNIYNNLKDLKNIDFSIFKEIGWENNIEKRMKKGAEVLIKEKINIIDLKYIKNIICFNENSQKEIKKILKKKGYNITIILEDYYKKFNYTINEKNKG